MRGIPCQVRSNPLVSPLRQLRPRHKCQRSPEWVLQSGQPSALQSALESVPESVPAAAPPRTHDHPCPH